MLEDALVHNLADSGGCLAHWHGVGGRYEAQLMGMAVKEG